VRNLRPYDSAIKRRWILHSPGCVPTVPYCSSRLCLKTPSSARERAVFRLAKTAKQAILVLSSMQSDAVKRKISRSKPDRVFGQSLVVLAALTVLPVVTHKTHVAKCRSVCHPVFRGLSAYTTQEMDMYGDGRGVQYTLHGSKFPRVRPYTVTAKLLARAKTRRFNREHYEKSCGQETARSPNQEF
jgi:hypothetical protein